MLRQTVFLMPTPIIFLKQTVKANAMTMGMYHPILSEMLGEAR